MVGYTQRFRRRWLAAKEKCRTGALGDVTLVTSRAFMNRLVAIDNYKRTDDPATISPMVISGTHALDICMWCLEGKTRGRVLRALGRQGAGPALPGHRRHRRHDHVFRRHHLSPQYLLGAAGDRGRARSIRSRSASSAPTGVLTIDDTHRDIVLAVSKPQSEGYNPDASAAGRFHGQLSARRHGARRTARTHGGRNRLVAQPRRARAADGRGAPVEEAHRNLMLTKALDLSAKRKQAGEAAARSRRTGRRPDPRRLTLDSPATCR